MTKTLLLLLTFAVFYPVVGQQKITIPDIRVQYEAFEYRKVITLADSALKSNDSLHQSDIIDIYLLKAQSHYALDDIQQARDCFVAILKLKSDYQPDAETISPKIVSLFNEVRAGLKEQNPVQSAPPVQKTEAGPVEEKEIKPDYRAHYQIAVLKSTVLPGWGHLSIREDTKAWILTSAAATNLAAMIYFMANTNSKEHRYLSETDPVLLNKKYNDYNTSYKIRNSLVVSFVALWLYTQYDLFMMSQQMASESVFNKQQAVPEMHGNAFSISLKIPI